MVRVGRSRWIAGHGMTDDPRPGRERSAEVYAEIQPLLSKRRAEAYSAVYRWPLRTAGELARNLAAQGGSDAPHRFKNIWSRLLELREMGVVEETGERECRSSGMVAAVWDVTNERPRPLPKKRRGLSASSVKYFDKAVDRALRDNRDDDFRCLMRARALLNVSGDA